MSVGEVAAYLRVSRSTVYQLMRDRVLTWTHICRCRRVSRASVLRYAQAGIHRGSY